MRRYWWTVWIKVAIVAVLLFFGYKYVTGMVMDVVSPYLIEEEEVGERSDNLIKQIVEKVGAAYLKEFPALQGKYSAHICDSANGIMNL